MSASTFCSRPAVPSAPQALPLLFHPVQMFDGAWSLCQAVHHGIQASLLHACRHYSHVQWLHCCAQDHSRSCTLQPLSNRMCVSLHCCKGFTVCAQAPVGCFASPSPLPPYLLAGIAAPSKAPEGSLNKKVDAAAGKGQDSEAQKGQGTRPPQFGDSAHLLDGIKLVAAKSGSTIKLSE